MDRRYKDGYNEYGNTYKPTSGERFYGEEGPGDVNVQTFAANGRSHEEMERRKNELLRTAVPDGYEGTASIEHNPNGSEYIVLKTRPQGRQR